MTDYKQILLEKGIAEFINSDVESFSSILKELYDKHITCNCFFKNQPIELWSSLLHKAESIKDNQNNFDLNFIKGFILLKNSINSKAYEYLTKAIKIDPSADIAYSLRATLDEEINCNKLNDAKEAVLLNPSARNYFVLANAYDYKQLKNAITYYIKAISLNNQFCMCL